MEPALEPNTPPNLNDTAADELVAGQAAPACPKCGGAMVLRTATRGTNAGNQFWGCRGWKPSGKGCDGIVNLAGPNGMSPEDETSAAEHVASVPRTIVLEPIAPRLQTRVFQCVGLPHPWVRALHEHSAPPSLARAFAQWRLDFPEPKGCAEEGMRTLVSIAEALLTRGTLTLCSRRFEEVILDLAGAEAASTLAKEFNEVAREPMAPLALGPFESEEERQFAERVLPVLAPGGLCRWLVPQIALSSLCESMPAPAQSRGDFYLAHPDASELLIEIDGPQHNDHVDSDALRDAALLASGMQVHRIPTSEVAAGEGPALDALGAEIGEWPVERYLPAGRVGFALRLCQAAHQLQLVLLEALRGGWVRWDEPEWTVSLALPPSIGPADAALPVLNVAACDLIELISHLSELYHGAAHCPSVRLQSGADSDNRPPQLTVQWGPAEPARLPSIPCFLIASTYVAREVAAPLTACRPATIPQPSRECVRWFLDHLFRKQGFLEGQWETIERALQGKDSIVLLPTGGGKSIAFQLAALLLPGRCIVIDPILSLIDDQIDNLGSAGISRCIGITSQSGSAEQREKILSQFAYGHYLFCYVAPERFQTVPFREALRQFTPALPVNLIAIDEAHCVSEWGHDFRTAYLNIGRNTREYCSFYEHTPPLVALTGTASRSVLKDVQRELGIPDFEAIITPRTFDRPELRFHIERCPSSDKAQRLKGTLARTPTEFGLDRTTFFRSRGDGTTAGLVFCPHVNGPYGISQTADELEQSLQIAVHSYSGTPPKSRSPQRWNDEKRRAAEGFKRNRDPLLVCTKAFGMGIDKPNVRYTVHLGLPDSIEAFYQEAGRAGRDKEPAHCSIILSIDDPDRAHRLLSPNAAIDEIVAATVERGGDDVTRALFFHVQSFRGAPLDLQDIAGMVDRLGDLSKCGEITVSFDDRHPERQEKALHRLVVIGVVDDYTLDYSRREFTVRVSGATQETVADTFVRYVATYQQTLAAAQRLNTESHRGKETRAFVLGIAGQLVAHIYGHIEKARRRMLLAMVEACTASGSGDGLRGRILEHLEKHEEYDAVLQDATKSEVGGLELIARITDLLLTPNDAAALRGAVSRALTSYPDVPGLLLLRGLAESLARGGDLAVAVDNLRAGLRYASREYRISPPTCGQALGVLLTRVGASSPEAARTLVAGTLGPDTDRELLRALIRACPDEVAALPCADLSLRLAGRCRAHRG
jgi:ATP-dependent DNA helicase RecQ